MTEKCDATCIFKMLPSQLGKQCGDKVCFLLI